MSVNKEYTFTLRRFFRQAFFPLVWIIGHVVLLLVFFSDEMEISEWFRFLLMVVLIPGLITIPTIWMLCNYLKFSCKKKVLFCNKGITVINTLSGEKNFVENTRLKKLHCFSNNGESNRFPWGFHEHIIFEVNEGSPIVITSYMADITSFRYDYLVNGNLRKIEIVFNESMFAPVNIKALQALKRSNQSLENDS